jgi:hypothetical protein
MRSSEPDRRQQPNAVIAGQQAHQERRNRHGGNREGERGAAAEAVPDMADDRAADRPHQIADREHAECRQQLGDGILMREEVTPDLGCEVAVDRKVVPFEHVADHARRDHSGSVRGVHVASRAACCRSLTH